jgi:cytochrome c oxidase assembly protein subunit 15
MYGAYVAGLDAGYAFNTWPMMGDEWFPSGAEVLTPFVSNFVDNPIVVQFVHRWLAFVVAILVATLAAEAWLKGERNAALAVVAAVVLQILLGIATLLSGVAIDIAVAHQGMAVLLLGAILYAGHRLGARTT